VPRTYTREEADEILRRALTEQAVDGASGIPHDDLVAAAREVGIPESAIEGAALQLGEHRLVAERVKALRSRKRRAFLRHLLVYVVVNFGIFFVDHSDGGAYFFQYPLIVWGVLLTLFAILQLAPDSEALTRRAERDLAKERRRAERERQRASRTRGHGSPGAAKEFEAAVQEGVSALLSGAARAIRGLTPPDGKRFRVDGHEDEPAAPSPRAKQRQTR
jgi:hypothetical protein